MLRILGSYQCEDCSREVRSKDIVKWDDDYWPFGLRLRCPHCEGDVVLRQAQVPALVAAVAIGVVLGVLAFLLRIPVG